MKGIVRILFSSIIITASLAAVVEKEELPPWFEIRNAQVESYFISGSTVEELREEMNKKGPHGWHGYTEWHLNWDCKEISVTCTVTLPFWKTGQSTPEVKKRYRMYWNRLALHEQGHVDIVTRLVDTNRVRVKSMECGAANRSWADTLARINRESAEYDRKTEHGKTQGAVF